MFHTLSCSLTIVRSRSAFVSFSEKKQCWESLNLILLRHFIMLCRINFSDTYFWTHNFGQFVPFWLQIYAMRTGRRIKLDKPSLVLAPQNHLLKALIIKLHYFCIASLTRRLFLSALLFYILRVWVWSFRTRTTSKKLFISFLNDFLNLLQTKFCQWGLFNRSLILLNVFYIASDEQISWIFLDLLRNQLCRCFCNFDDSF